MKRNMTATSDGIGNEHGYDGSGVERMQRHSKARQRRRQPKNSRQRPRPRIQPGKAGRAKKAAQKRSELWG